MMKNKKLHYTTLKKNNLYANNIITKEKPRKQKNEQKNIPPKIGF